MPQIAAAVEQLPEHVRHRLVRRRPLEAGEQFPEPPQGGGRAGRDRPLVDRPVQSPPERIGRVGTGVGAGEQGPRRSRRRRRQRLEGGHHPLADAPRRGVDDPAEAHVVVGVDEQPQIRQRVLDLLALVEPHAAHDPVGEPRAGQRVLDRPRLGVRAVQHAGRGLAAGQRLAQARGDEVGLLEIVAAAEAAHEGPAGAVGPQPLLEAVPVPPDDRVGGVEDDLGRAVVPLEPHHRRLGVIPLEVEDVAQVGAAPLVDRLVGVADDAQVAVPVGQEPDEPVLRRVGVLVLVDHDEPEALAVAAPARLVGLEQLLRLQQEVVEVEGVGLGQGAPVPVVDLGRELAPGAPAFAPEALRRLSPVLRAADVAEGLPGRQQLVVGVEVGEDAADHRQLVGGVVDDEVAGPLDPALAAQDPRAEGVEGRDPEAAAPGVDQLPDPAAHLLGRLVRERDGEDLVRRGAAVRDQPGGAVRDDPGLPRPRPRDDQERAVGVQHRPLLLGVQP